VSLLLANEFGLSPSNDGPRSPQDASQLDDLCAELRVSAGSGGDFDVKIEDSFDGGTTWGDWITFATATGATVERKAPARPHGGVVRASDLVGAGGSGFAYTVRLNGDVKQ